MSKIGNNLSSKIILTKPRITEKATFLLEANHPVYTFVVPTEANKIEIKQAIKNLYKVNPLKVNIINLPAKALLRRGKSGSRSAIKKALVFLKTGDKIELV
ncbi:MAG: 50S ribosomal protein L23 [Candidatus Vogelbacteria bacterium CG22_combo_CG10-13_8_21_14_all_37_9]|uniref:Large ribosomal subunit protein uL23 n=1 Tax=Candidatus Vogelbacteria bacterium CG22_combo_CG10-13_8_21_14_all_37_9 TaxID=1975046 RepID=A0A2H0BL64_9BACT|nr:MAG: 50S ribosomal protein L23 [bacterium CG10_37_50]PIP58289.1 MAG: 50S ribosomal protein L23 [Candidatus Vogelbacteria bacterium CG22_combo_CG10-13_8_21_14_all_37_9]